jgi:hypothetical protein
MKTTSYRDLCNSNNPDLHGDSIEFIQPESGVNSGFNAQETPIPGQLDYRVIEMNDEGLARLRCEEELKSVPGATHLFEEPSTWNKLPS